MPIRHSSTRIWKTQSGTKTALRHPARACRTESRSRDDMLAEGCPSPRGRRGDATQFVQTPRTRALCRLCRRGRAAQMFTRDSRSGAGHDPAEKAQGGGRESGEMVRLKSHGSSSASRRRAQKAKRLQPPSRWRAVPAAEKENRGAESAPCLFGRGQLHVGGVCSRCGSAADESEGGPIRFAVRWIFYRIERLHGKEYQYYQDG